MTFSQTSKQSKRREIVWLYAPLLIWIGVIFFLSSSQGSMTQTSRIIRPILEFLFPTASFETITFYHGLVRKFAHFAEYLVLGLLSSRAWLQSEMVRTAMPYLFAVGVVVLVAVIDESTQAFNPSRTGSALDVLIDLAGGVLGVLLYAFRWRGRRSK